MEPNPGPDICVPGPYCLSVTNALVLAHQGGWDEMLFVALPIGLFGLLLYIANKKAQAQLEAEEQAESEQQPDQQ
jgi:hypothetical protein